MSRNDLNNFLVTTRKTVALEAENAVNYNDGRTIASAKLTTISDIHKATIDMTDDKELLEFLHDQNKETLDDVEYTKDATEHWMNPKIELEIHKIVNNALNAYLK